MVGEAFRLRGVIDVDTGPAERGISVFSTKIGGVGSILASAVGTAAIAGIAAVGAGFVTATVSATGFEKTMSAVKAVSGATATEMSSLSGLALQLGRDTSFSASEAGKGIEELVKGGLSIPDIMNGAAKATLALAAAGGVSLPDAATIAANALSQFSLKGADMAHVADLIAGAANASAIDVGDFKFSLAAAGAVAATVGFSFDDLAQGIAIMGQAGVKGSDAGTSLKTMMLSLQPSTKKQNELFRELGIITSDGANRFFDATGKIKGMGEVAQILQDSLAGMTQQQKLATLEVLFGSDAIRAGAILSKAGAAGFNEMATAMGKVTAESVGAEKLNNLSGSIEQLKGSAETLAITFGFHLTPLFKDATDGAVGFVNSLIPIADTWGPRISDAWKTVGQVFRNDWSPSESIDPIVNAVGILATFFRDTVIPATKEVGAALLEVFGGVVDWFKENWPLIKETAQTVADAFGASNGGMAASVKTTWDDINRIVGIGLANLGDALKLAMHVINGDWDLAWKDITAINDREQKARLAKAEEEGKLWQGIIDNWTGGALTKFDTWTKDIGTTLSSAWGDIRDKASEAWSGAQSIASAIEDAWTTIKTNTDTVGAALKNVMIALWDLLYTEVIQPKLKIITDAVAFGWQIITDKAHEIFDPMLIYIRDTIWEPIRSVVETKINAARDLFGSAVLAVSTKAHEIFDPMLAWWDTTIWEPIRAAVDTAVYGPKGAYTQFESAVAGIKGVVDGTLQTVKTAWEGVWTAIQHAAESPAAAMTEIIRLVGKLKDIMPSWLIPHSPTPFQIGLEGIANAARSMDGAFGSMGDGLEGIGRIAALATSIGGVDFGRAAAAISASETGGGTHLVQQGGGGAMGPFQFDPGGELRNFARALGVSLQEAGVVAITKPMLAAKWALDGYLGDALRRGIDQGISGADLANYGSRVGQRPAGDNWKMAGEWFRRLFPGYASGGIAWTPQLAMVGESGPEAIIPRSWFANQQNGASYRNDSMPSQTHEFIVRDPSGRVLAEWFVRGRVEAIKQGRVPSTVS